MKPMERYTFDQNVTQYFEWLRKEHCKITKNDALFRYLHKRAIGVLWKKRKRYFSIESLSAAVSNV